MASAAVPYFQGGDYVELLSAQGKAPASTWKIQGKIAKSFDKAIKGNSFQMDGSSETKMQLPKTVTSTTSSLGLTQRFLVFQVLVPHTRSFSVEIGFSDVQKIRRRLVFASAFRETTMTTLHVQIPIGSNVPRDQWMNFVFDLQALTERFFPASSYRSMESICVSGSCRLKRIFTMKDAPFCQRVYDNLDVQLLQFKHQRLQSRDPASVPTAIASFSDMKEIPKQFVFSAAPSCLPIPTEYFLVLLEREEHPPSSTATPTAAGVLSTKAVPGGRTGNAVKGATSSGTTKPKSAGGSGSRTRPATDGKAVGSRSPVSDVRVRSAPPPTQPLVPRQEDTMIHSERVTKVHRSPQTSLVASTHNSAARPGYAISHSSTPERSSSHRAIRVSSARMSKPHDVEEDEVHSEMDERRAPDRSSGINQFNASSDRNVQRYDIDAVAAKKRKQHRQNVISEIQSKLDQLTKEAEDEEERDRDMFLRHTSIPAELRSPLDSQSSESKDAPDESTVDHWQEKDLLRSPEPMVLRRAHAAKKPEIAFTSSIFNFDRGGSSSKQSSAQSDLEKSASSAKRLFDWDSLLDDSVGSAVGSRNSAPRSSATLDQKPVSELSHSKARVSHELLAARSTTTKQSKSDQASATQSEPNGISHENTGTDDAEDNAHMDALHAKRQVHPPTMTPSSAENPERALESDSTWERHEFEHLSAHPTDQFEDDELLQSSFDFSTSPAKSDYPDSGGHDEKESQTSSPRAGSEASLDFTDDVRMLERIDDRLASCIVGDDGEGEDHDSSGEDDNDDGNPDNDDDSFDFDELVISDRNSKPNKMPRPESDSIEPVKRAPNDAASTNTSKAEPKASAKVLEGARSDGKKQQTREGSTGNVIHARPTASPPQKPGTAARDTTESGLQGSSSRVVSSSSRRLASLLESTDWSQLPLSSTVVSQDREPRSKTTKPMVTEQSRDKPHSATRSSKPNDATSSSLELIYDPILRCYYDPVGKKYYTLAK